MPVHRELEEEVKDTALAILQALARRTDAGLEDFLSYLADDVCGVGSGRGDFYTTREAFSAQLMHEQVQLNEATTLGPVTHTLEVPLMNVRMLRPILAAVDGEMKVVVQVEAGSYVVTPRFSLLLLSERRAEYGGDSGGAQDP